MRLNAYDIVRRLVLDVQQVGYMEQVSHQQQGSQRDHLHPHLTSLRLLLLGRRGCAQLRRVLERHQPHGKQRGQDHRREGTGRQALCREDPQERLRGEVARRRSRQLRLRQEDRLMVADSGRQDHRDIPFQHRRHYSGVPQRQAHERHR